MEYKRPRFPEPVPSVTQLAVLPFLAAIDGFLSATAENKPFRVTMHRVMAREQHRYIQQICEYLGQGFEKSDQNAGRLFPQGTGLMGKAVSEKRIFRTKRYDTEDALLEDLRIDLEKTNPTKSIEQSAVSFLAIPLIGSDDETVLILYIDSYRFNHFADDEIVKSCVDMCHGLCRLFDWFSEEEPLEKIRNFLTPEKDFKPGNPTAFENLQEAFDADTPKFRVLKSFNYEMTSA